MTRLLGIAFYPLRRDAQPLLQGDEFEALQEDVDHPLPGVVAGGPLGGDPQVAGGVRMRREVIDVGDDLGRVLVSMTIAFLNGSAYSSPVAPTKATPPEAIASRPTRPNGSCPLFARVAVAEAYSTGRRSSGRKAVTFQMSASAWSRSVFASPATSSMRLDSGATRSPRRCAKSRTSPPKRSEERRVGKEWRS